MDAVIRIGIVGDYDGRPSHVATEESVKHAAKQLGEVFDVNWIPTTELMEGADQKLCGFDGIWVAPGSPYQSMLGALNAIQYAREKNIPYIGTCGGFQHAAIEYARNVLQIKELQAEDFDPYAPNSYITALACSLVAQTRHIILDKNSVLYRIYGSAEVVERYNCSFGVSKEFQDKLNQGGLKIVGTDEEGEVRIVTIEENRFFVASLFQPQLSSSYETPHPLIVAYLSNVRDYHRGI